MKRKRRREAQCLRVTRRYINAKGGNTYVASSFNKPEDRQRFLTRKGLGN